MAILGKGKYTSSLRDSQKATQPAPRRNKFRVITGGRLYGPIDQQIEMIRSRAVDWVLDKLGPKAFPAFTRILYSLFISTGGQRVPWQLMATLAQSQYDSAKGSLQIDRNPSWVDQAIELRAFAAVVRNLSSDILGDVVEARQLLEEQKPAREVLALVTDRQTELLSQRIHKEWDILIIRFRDGAGPDDRNSPHPSYNDRPAALTKSRKESPAKARGLRARIGAGFPTAPVPSVMKVNR